MPNVTPLSQLSNHSGKQEFGDWSVYDDNIGRTIVFDNSLFDPFTQSARELSQRPFHPGNKRCNGHPTLIATATERRSIKYLRKGPGCEERNQIFLPIINSHNGAFVPTPFDLLTYHGDIAKRLFSGDDLARNKKRIRSAEEALIRRWSRRVTDIEKGGKGVYDLTLSTDRAAGLLTTHTHRMIAYAAIRSSSNAALYVIRRNRLSFTL